MPTNATLRVYVVTYRFSDATCCKERFIGVAATKACAKTLVGVDFLKMFDAPSSMMTTSDNGLLYKFAGHEWRITRTTVKR